MTKYDIVIIGSGLGGLECGYHLSKKGFNVCILEKDPQVGGCLQTFRRKGITLDTGFHFVGGMDEGQYLYKIFDYFDLLDLPWHRMDDEGFAEVVLGEQSWSIPCGFERWVDTLSSGFPAQRKELEKYARFLKEVGDKISNNFSPNGASANFPFFEQSAQTFLRESISDPTLQRILAGSSMTMELSPQLPLYIFAQINSSFIQSAWRLRGGGSQIAERLVQNIRRMGGTVITGAEVTSMVEKNGRIDTVVCKSGERFQGRYIISNLHPALTLQLIPESSTIRNIYRKRTTNLPNTSGMFTVHLQLKEGVVPYLNRNIFIHKGENLWDNSYRSGDTISSLMISYQVPEEGGIHTRNIDLLTPMHWEEVSRWENTNVEKRGDDYRQFKQEKAEACIRMAAERLPGLSEHIEGYYTSTPLTYRDYTRTWQGSAYGIRKDCNNTLQTLLSPQTPIKNLFLTGQNLNLHGILGVSMTAFFTCVSLMSEYETRITPKSMVI